MINIINTLDKQHYIRIGYRRKYAFFFTYISDLEQNSKFGCEQRLQQDSMWRTT